MAKELGLPPLYRGLGVIPTLPPNLLRMKPTYFLVLACTLVLMEPRGDPAWGLGGSAEFLQPLTPTRFCFH